MATATNPPAAEASPFDGVEAIGPFGSIDAYCEDAKSTFVAKDCESMMDQGANLCSCNTGNDIIRGKREVLGFSPKNGFGIGPGQHQVPRIARAQLLLVERSAAGMGHCDLAIHAVDGWDMRGRLYGRNWYVAPALMPCKNAPVSHDSETWITVTSFDASHESDVDVLTLAWTETTSNQDVDGTKTKRDRKFTTRCLFDEYRIRRCAKPTMQAGGRPRRGDPVEQLSQRGAIDPHRAVLGAI